MQYFFEKKNDVFFFPAIFFSKNPVGLDIVSSFFFEQIFTFFFFIFSYAGLSIGDLRDLLVIKYREFEALITILTEAAGKTAV